MTLDRATVEQMAKWGYLHGSATVKALAEDWLRQEEALKVATDALEKIADFPVDVQSGNSNFKSGIARSALAAIRQEPQP